MELMLKVIMEDQTAIKNQLGDLIRTTEIVKGHQAQIDRIVNKFDSCESRLGKAENAISRRIGKEHGTADFLKWSTALVSAFLIAMYLNSSKPASSAVLHTEQKALIHKVIKEKDKK